MHHLDKNFSEIMREEEGGETNISWLVVRSSFGWIQGVLSLMFQSAQKWDSIYFNNVCISTIYSMYTRKNQVSQQSI